MSRDIMHRAVVVVGLCVRTDLGNELRCAFFRRLGVRIFALGGFGYLRFRFNILRGGLHRRDFFVDRTRIRSAGVNTRAVGFLKHADPFVYHRTQFIQIDAHVV